MADGISRPQELSLGTAGRIYRALQRRLFPTAEARLLQELRERRTGTGRTTLVLPDGQQVQGLRPLEAYNEYKDLFIQRLYAFHPRREDPLILDGGSYVGLSILWFKLAYPGARVVGFECDPEIFALLQENVRANKLRDVELVNAALAPKEGELPFHASGSDSGSLVPPAGTGTGPARTVRAVRLSPYLTSEVDLLKLNIEGAEFEVLEEARACLRNVRELIIEVHSFAGHEQRLDEILKLLRASGFRYLLHHFDYDSNLAVKPPFELRSDTTYILLLYACRWPE